MAGQIVLLREILVIFHGTELSIGIFYSAWLAAIGLGASVGAWIVRRLEHSLGRIFLYGLALLGYSLIGQVLLIRCVPALFGVAPAELAPLSGILVAVPLGNAVTAFLTGFLFPIGCAAVAGADDRLIARLYVAEALGSLAGGLAFTFVFVRMLSPLQIVASIATGVAAAALAFGTRLDKRASLVGATPLLVLAIVLLTPLGSRIADSSIRFRWQTLHPGLKLLLSEPTQYQQVELARLGRQISLFGNGTIVSSFPDPATTDRLAALIMAEKPGAKKVLLVGGGIGSLVRSLLHYPVDYLDIVEPDPSAFRIAERFMPREEAQALKDPRVKLVFQDGRFYVNRLGKTNYDVIVALMPDPVSSFWNRYFTLEFFRAVHTALAPDGIFLTRATSAENFWGNEVASFAGSIFHTLRSVFPSVEGTPGDETLFLASPSEGVVSLDPAALKVRYAQLGWPIFDPAGFDTILPPERTAFVKSELQRSPKLINTDFRPISSSLALILWGRFSGTERMEVLDTLRRAGLAVYLIPIAVFVIARVAFAATNGQAGAQQNRFPVMLSMGALAAAAMGLQIVLIYAYQSLFGYVFERVGLFAAMFMLGLAVGGAVAGRFLGSIHQKTQAIVGVLIAFLLLCLAAPHVVGTLKGHEPWMIESAIFGLVLISAVLTGAAFPLVASKRLELAGSAGESSGWTEAADHYGAAAGAAITGTLMVPLLGMSDACLVLAITPAAAVAVIGLESAVTHVVAGRQPRDSTRRQSFPFVRTSWCAAGLVVIALVWSVLIGPPQRTMTVQFDGETLESNSGSTEFTFHEQPFPYYTGESATTAGKTFSLATHPVAGEVRGYGGPMNLLVSVSDTGVIAGVRIVESKETPSYLIGMDQWLTKLKGRSILEPEVRELDGLTGATITCRAVTDIVYRTGRKIAGPLLGQPISTATPEMSFWESAAKDLRFWAVVGLLLFFVVAFYAQLKWMRLACLAAGFGVLGLWLNAPFTSLDAGRLLHGEMPAVGTPWRITLFGGVLVISALWGQVFCGYLCPFGALQEFLSLRSLRKRASFPVERAARYVKYLVLVLVLGLYLVTDNDGWFGFSPLLHFFSWRMDQWVLALCMAVLGASIFYFRFWCRYLCPAGAFLALFNKVRLLRRWSPRTAPARCDLGVAFIGDVDCIRCHRCRFDLTPDSEEGR
ncbi:MAG: fused MFS/spermidine synthase [Desulfomonile sp.]|nr:fused MFS/spermidine synthase [Desulfomonile sp.]